MDCLIGTLNCRGLRDILKRKKLFSWLREKNQDLFLLQETHSTAGDEVTWEREWGVKYALHMVLERQEE